MRRLAISVAVLSTTVASCSSSPSNESQFLFAQSTDITQDVMSEFCAPNSPISWDDQSKQAVQSLYASYRVAIPEFMQVIVEPGPLYLVKCKSAGFNGAFFPINGKRYLFLADHVFVAKDDAAIRDYLGFDVLSFVLLHESAHAWDEANGWATSSPQVQTLMGWVTPTQLKTFDMNEVQATLIEMKAFGVAGNYLQAIKTTRDYGVAHGYPTSYAMSAPIEMFAEGVTWTYHDKQINTYVSPYLVNLVKDNVLK